jgi:hypothetical protein
MNKNLVSALILIGFAFLAIASSVNKLHLGAFTYGNRVEDPSYTKNFIEMNDGTKVYGDKIDWQSGFLLKDQIKIDGQKYKIRDVRGYQKDQVFFGRLNITYMKRIVHGKINVYVDFTNVTQTSADRNGFAHTTSYTRTDHYSQRGDSGPMVAIAGQSDIEDLVNSCPLAVEMAHKSNHQIRKAIKHDRNYLNEIFDVYNNGCKPPPDNK